MKAIDSPRGASNSMIQKRLASIRNRHGVEKIFRFKAQYKEEEPWMEDFPLWNEEALDFMIVLPPRND